MSSTRGQVLGERYQLTERIAVGGMSEVWRAHDRTLDRTVAVKLLRDDLAGREAALARLRAEARNGGGLAHPNLATLLDYGEEAGNAFLVMEHVSGEPLSAVLDREGTLPVPDVLRILGQCASGLHAAHAAAVVHRDVKPSNILLTPGGLAKVTDFGISLGAGQPALTAAGMVMGTGQYLPPELTLGHKASPAGDVYALGIVGYEALVGHRPFTGANQVAIAFAHVEEPLPPLPDNIPAPVRDLIAAMLAKEPAQRPRSAAAVARTVEGLLNAPAPGGPTPPDHPAPVHELRPPSVPDNDPPPAPDDDPPPATQAPSTQPAGTVPPPSHRPLPSRRTLRDEARTRDRRRWRLPSWQDFAADRRWLVAVGVGVVVAFILTVVLIGTVANGDGTSSGTGHDVMTRQPTDRL